MDQKLSAHDIEMARRFLAMEDLPDADIGALIDHGEAILRQRRRKRHQEFRARILLLEREAATGLHRARLGSEG